MATRPPAAEPQRIVVGALTIDVAPAAEACHVRLEGELDLQSSPSLRAELDRLISAEVPVVLDLGPLDFIDSSGIRCLTLAASRSRASGDHLRVLPPAGGQVEQVLRLTRVGQHLPLAKR